MERVHIVCSSVVIGFMQIVVCHRLCINALIQWHGDNVELVYADDSISIEIADPM
jgi:hypothetical protein